MQNTDTHDRRAMTLSLSDAEMNALEELARRKDLNKTIVIRQALRLYQMLDQKIRLGSKLFVEDGVTKDKSELVLI